MKAEEYFKKEYGTGHISMVMAEDDLVSMYSLIQEYAEAYAKDQIEKDRERAEPVMTITRKGEVISEGQFAWIANDADHIHINSSWKNTPLILD